MTGPENETVLILRWPLNLQLLIETLASYVTGLFVKLMILSVYFGQQIKTHLKKYNILKYYTNIGKGLIC